MAPPFPISNPSAPGSIPGRSSSKPPFGSSPPSGSTTEKTDTVAHSVGFGKESTKIGFSDDDGSVSLKPDKSTKKKERKIGGQKVEITAKEPHKKKPVDISPTQWESLTKVSDKAKEIFWPKKSWKKWLMYTLGLPISAPAALATTAGIGLAHTARGAVHGVKYLKANSTKDSKLPPFIYNNLKLNRPKDFIELTEDEKDKYCEKMDKAWIKYQKKYNKNKDEKEQLRSEDVVRWGFEIPKKKGGRFGFRIAYRIPDKNGKYVKDSKDKSRRYKVDKNGYFIYKTTYLFWGKLNLDDLEDVFVESTSIVKDWDDIKIDGQQRERLRASTLKELKEKVKNIKTSAKDVKAKEIAKQNCWLHTTIQRALNNKKMMDALKDEKRLNQKHAEKFRTSSVKEREDLWNSKAKIKNLIECIKKCLDKSPYEQYNIIEEKYADTKSYAEKIREDLKLKGKNSQQDSDYAYKVLENYLNEIGAIDLAKVEEKSVYSIGDEVSSMSKIPLSSIYIPVLKRYQNLDLTKALDEYFKPDKKSTTKGEDGVEKTVTENTKILNESTSITIDMKDKAKLENIPLALKYEDNKFIADPSGNYEFNYASIHHGDSGGGHYFSIYKENGAYYIYDITKDLSDKEALKIEPSQVAKYLENAKTLVYEKKALKDAEDKDEPSKDASEDTKKKSWFSDFSLFGRKIHKKSKES